MHQNWYQFLGKTSVFRDYDARIKLYHLSADSSSTGLSFSEMTSMKKDNAIVTEENTWKIRWNKLNNTHWMHRISMLPMLESNKVNFTIQLDFTNSKLAVETLFKGTMSLISENYEMETRKIMKAPLSPSTLFNYQISNIRNKKSKIIWIQTPLRQSEIRMRRWRKKFSLCLRTHMSFKIEVNKKIPVVTNI